MKTRKALIEVTELIVPEDLNKLKEWCDFYKLDSEIEVIDDLPRINIKTKYKTLNLRSGYILYLFNGVPEFAEVPQFREYGKLFDKHFTSDTPQKP